jgi:Hydrazine synthase alpha subunit middle domain
VRRFAAVILFSLALAACIAWMGVAAQPSSDPSLPAVLYTTTPAYVVDAWMTGGERFPAGAQVMVQERETSRALVTGFTATADAAVSFDGAKVLFAGKRETKDPWQVWEVAVNGGDPRRITTCASDCVRPFYLPGNRLVYAQELAGRFVLAASALEGGTALQLTYAPGNAMPTDVLRDGRILFEAAYPMGDGTSPEIYTVYPDGSGVESYRCDHGAKRQAGKQTASGDIVFASGDGLGRFTSALAHQVDMKAPQGEFAGDAVQVAANEYLVPWRSDAKSRYSLQRWKLATNSMAPLVAANDADVVQPALAQPREMPKLYPSGLHVWNHANLLCLNTYTSKYKFATGSVAGMKLYTSDAKGKPKLLGSSPVEPDGSFYVQVPGDKPLQIELLDRHGKTLQREQGWWWMRKGEQRICVGCHAGPERSPENAVPAVLVKGTKPVTMTGTAAVNEKGGE